MRLDRLLTVDACYDGPLLGIAELDGVPHIYQHGYMYALDDDASVYFLSPIAPELLALVMEDWAIWRRYLAASGTPEAADAQHPALACDRARHDALELAIGDRLTTDPDKRKRFKADFWPPATPADPDDLWDGQRVQWTPCETPEAVQLAAPR